MKYTSSTSQQSRSKLTNIIHASCNSALKAALRCLCSHPYGWHVIFYCTRPAALNAIYYFLSTRAIKETVDKVTASYLDVNCTQRVVHKSGAMAPYCSCCLLRGYASRTEPGATLLIAGFVICHGNKKFFLPVL